MADLRFAIAHNVGNMARRFAYHQRCVFGDKDRER